MQSRRPRPAGTQTTGRRRAGPSRCMASPHCSTERLTHLRTRPRCPSACASTWPTSAARAGIAVAPLKGSLLATGYYAEPGLRPMNDLDLLVRPADEPRMLELLAGLGYRQIARGWKHVALAHPDGGGPTVSYEGEHPD